MASTSPTTGDLVKAKAITDDEVSAVTESLNEADHEIRSLLRFAAGLGVSDALVFEVYEAVRREADAAGATAEERVAEARRRLIQAA